ncbi:MAG TPA: amidohydrolase family protein, partial [Candidatus Dormibacteraeota bacterium]|nr:amidohydrolase family protein [Candidatus Dormibacteraeota bacterium]
TMPRADTAPRRCYAGLTPGMRITAVALLGALAVEPAGAALNVPTQAFTNAVLIDGTGASAVEHATVVVRGALIEAAGPAAQVKVPAGAHVTDLHGMVLMPGLADMHVHLLGGWAGHAVGMLGYRRYMNALLYAGITTVLDTGNVQPYIVQLRAETAAGRLLGPHIYCVGGIVDGADPVWPPISYAVSSVGQVAPVVKGLKRDNVDLIKGYVGLSHSVLERLVEEGRKVSLRVIVDQWQRNGSNDLVEDGIYGFAHLPTRLLSADNVRFMHEHNTVFISTIIVYETQTRARLKDLAFLQDPLVRDTSPPSFLAGLRSEAARKLSEEEATHAKHWESLQQNAMANAKALTAAGVLLAAGTDAPYPGDMQGEGLHHELELLVKAGLTPVEALTVATRNAARLIGASDWGTIEAGKFADLIVVDGRPDQNISDTRKIVEVMQRGRRIDRESLKISHQNDPGYEPVSPTDF